MTSSLPCEPTGCCLRQLEETTDDMFACQCGTYWKFNGRGWSQMSIFEITRAVRMGRL